MNQPILEVKDITKTFTKSTRTREFKTIAVDHVSVSLQEGETLGIIGESGSGKTTLARILVKLIQPDSGYVYLRGRDVTHATGSILREFRNTVQMIFQDPYASLDPRLTVKQLI
ncbi:MAG: ATP-binding cassette domain-containing protein [Thermoprotei archaeon]